MCFLHPCIKSSYKSIYFRLVVGYFRNFGHLSLEQITGVAEESQHFHSNPSQQQQQQQFSRSQQQQQFSRSQQQQQAQQHPPRQQQSSSDRNSDLDNLKHHLIKSSAVGNPRMIQVISSCIKLLEGEGITANSLLERYSIPNSSLGDFLMNKTLFGLRHQFPDIHLRHQIVRPMLDWCRQNVRSGGNGVTRAARTEIHRDLRPVYTSLMAVKHYLLKALPGG